MLVPHEQAKYIAHHTKKTEEQIMEDFTRPKYFNPYEAVGYGLIDRVRLAALAGLARKTHMSI